MKNSLNMDQRETWNKSSAGIPLDKDPSTYAVEREKIFPRGSVICDLGGGTGADTIYFLQKGHRVILVDISDLGLEVARKKVEVLGLANKLLLIQKDLSEGVLPIQSDTCNIVYSRLSLHYFFPQQLIALFREILRILKVGGVAYLTIKSPKDKKEMVFLRKTAKEIESGVFEDNGQIKTRFEESKLREMMNLAQITRFEIKDYEENFFGRKDRVKSGLDKLLLVEIIIRK